MNLIELTNKIIELAEKNLPKEAKDELLKQIEFSKRIDAPPIGAVLVAIYVLTYVKFPEYVDNLLGVEHTPVEVLREKYNGRGEDEEYPIPSPGIILSIVVADMIAHPRNITRVYKFEEMAEKWHTGPLLGIEPSILNDDRILRTMSMFGKDMNTMHEVLFMLVIDASKKANIPLNKFILDTTILELSGEFEKAPKVKAGRGKNSFSQLVVSLVIASGSKLPILINVHPGGTHDASTFKDSYNMINRIADEGSIEIIMDRIYPTAENIKFLKDRESERKVYWLSPLKTNISRREVREKVDIAYKEGGWEPINYRSTKEIRSNDEPPLEAYETKWTMIHEEKPELETGQKRRVPGSINRTLIEHRAVFYKNKIQAEKEKEHREEKIKELEEQFTFFKSKLNKRKYTDYEYCKNKLNELIKKYKSLKPLFKVVLGKNDLNIITFESKWDDELIANEVKYDGIFVLLTNYEEKQVGSNQLIKKYRTRDQIEVDFKELKGLLDLERVYHRLPERIDTYIFLKGIALFVLTFMCAIAKSNDVKTTIRKLLESMGDMILAENNIEPLNMKIYTLGRDTELNRFFRNYFNLPDPIIFINELTKIEFNKLEEYVLKWYKSYRDKLILQIE
jgi:transposase